VAGEPHFPPGRAPRRFRRDRGPAAAAFPPQLAYEALKGGLPRDGRDLCVLAVPVRLLADACELVRRPLGVSTPLYRRYDNIGEAERLLGYRPRVGLEEGLGRTLAWHRPRGVLAS
jgi:hypothetical protein